MSGQFFPDSLLRNALNLIPISNMEMGGSGVPTFQQNMAELSKIKEEALHLHYIFSPVCILFNRGCSQLQSTASDRRAQGTSPSCEEGTH